MAIPTAWAVAKAQIPKLKNRQIHLAEVAHQKKVFKETMAEIKRLNITRETLLKPPSELDEETLDFLLRNVKSS